MNNENEEYFNEGTNIETQNENSKNNSVILESSILCG